MKSEETKMELSRINIFNTNISLFLSLYYLLLVFASTFRVGNESNCIQVSFSLRISDGDRAAADANQNKPFRSNGFALYIVSYRLIAELREPLLLYYIIN